MQVEPPAAEETALPAIDLRGEVALLSITTAAHIMQGAPRLRVGHGHLSKERRMTMCGRTSDLRSNTVKKRKEV